ncbi:MAG: PH domain-containing protein [Flavobacterium sp.]|nr:PH domain-containing protein [Flavobacterium sp.]
MENFTNNQIDFDTLPKFEEITFTPLHKDYLNVIYIGNAIFSVLLTLAFFGLLLFNEDSREYLLPLILIKILIIGLLFWISTIAFRKKGYAIREKDVVFRKGLLATTTTIIPFNRIQHVALHEGVLSRMYDLSELQVYTAGGSSSDLHISGLPKMQAEKMKTFLMGIIESEESKQAEEPTLPELPIDSDELERNEDAKSEQ